MTSSSVQLAEHLARGRSPDPDHGVRVAHVVDLDRRVVEFAGERQPAAVAVDGAGARDDPERVLAQARNRDVGDDPAAAVAELRVDDASDGPVDPAVADAVEQRQCSRTAHLELAERGHVEDADPLADRGVLSPHMLEPRRRRESERALVSAASPPRSSGLKVIRAFPAVLGPEDGAEFLGTRIEWAWSKPAPPLVGVEWVPEPVVVAVRLTRGGRREPRVAVGLAEPPRPVGGDVLLCLAVGHPLGERPAEPAGASEAVERQTGRDPEPGGAGNRTEQRVRIGRHRVRVSEQPDDPRALEERKAVDRALKQRREAIDV